MTFENKPVVIIGGGLAGMAAALRLQQAEIPFQLIESRPQLGGRAMSYQHASGQWLDNCQHALMRCCTHLVDLYQQLEVEHLIEWHRSFYFVARGGEIDTLEAGDLPAPAHLSESLFRFKCLSPMEKTAIALAMGVMMHTNRSQWQSRSFGDWLRFVRQPEGAIRKYWEPVCVSAINESIDQAAADLTMQVFQEGFMRHEHSYEMGIAKVPLSRLYENFARLVSPNPVLTGCSALAFNVANRKVESVQINLRKRALQAIGRDSQDSNDIRHSHDTVDTLEASHVILAVPFDRVLKLANEEMQNTDTRFQYLNRMRVSPIAGIHVWLRDNDGDDRFNLPHAALVDSPIHWLFNKGRVTTAEGEPAQLLNLVISAARDWIGRSRAETLLLIQEELASYFPAIAPEDILDIKVVVEKRATFSGTPGFTSLRPKTSGEITNLFFAGDYTQSGWPATMEGAVRSGNFAAKACMSAMGVAQRHPAMQLPDDQSKNQLTRFFKHL